MRDWDSERGRREGRDWIDRERRERTVRERDRERQREQ